MTKRKRTFISFDYDHDEELKNLLVGQAKNQDSILNNWEENARHRIKSCDVVVVICGKYTDKAAGVSIELKIAQDEKIPYFLLYGRGDEHCVKPSSAKNSDKIYKWTWENLKKLIEGSR